MKKLTIVALFLGLFVAISAKAAVFDNDLYFGLQGNADVSKLQEFLTAQGVYSGPVSGNFFSLTLAGVKAFQTAQGISPAAGYFGPLTRAKANDLVGTDVSASNNEAVVETGSAPAPAPSSTVEQQLDALLKQVALLQNQINEQKKTNDAIAGLQIQLQSQNSAIQQQNQTLGAIQQNTTPPPVQVPVPTPPTPQPTVTQTQTNTVSSTPTSTVQTPQEPSTISFEQKWEVYGPTVGRGESTQDTFRLDFLGGQEAQGVNLNFQFILKFGKTIKSVKIIEDLPQNDDPRPTLCSSGQIAQYGTLSCNFSSTQRSFRMILDTTQIEQIQGATSLTIGIDNISITGASKTITLSDSGGVSVQYP